MRNVPLESWVDEQPLDRDLCQRIHYQALLRAAHACRTEEVPPTVDLPRLRELGQLLGSGVYLSHPQAVERLFAGVSLGFYRMIVELYCSRLERSSAMVWRIVQVRAAGRVDIPYEAVWALCMHLEEYRRHETEVTIERDPASWWLFSLRYEKEGQAGVGSNGQFLIVCLLDLAREAVIAFRVTDDQHASTAYGLVVYDALLAGRHPGQHAAAGLTWRVPERLIVERKLFQGPQEGCSRLGIALETRPDPPPLWHRLQSGFKREITGRGRRGGPTRSTRTCINCMAIAHCASARNATASITTWSDTTATRPGSVPRCATSCRRTAVRLPRTGRSLSTGCTTLMICSRTGPERPSPFAGPS